MPLRQIILRLVLCFTFLLASNYVQAMVHVNSIGSATEVHITNAKPPCHKAVPGKFETSDGHHDGCCSSFTFAIGLTTTFVPDVPCLAAPVHEIDYGNFGRSDFRQPLSPPPRAF